MTLDYNNISVVSEVRLSMSLIDYTPATVEGDTADRVPLFHFKVKFPDDSREIMEEGR